jgi:hypothetical protein
MKKEDAKQRIRELWLERPKNERKLFPDVMSFYQQLRREHPELLKFKSDVDKYQVVNAFVKNLTEEP